MECTRSDHYGIEASWACIGDMDFGKALSSACQRINSWTDATGPLSTTLAAGETVHLGELYAPHIVVGAL